MVVPPGGQSYVEHCETFADLDIQIVHKCRGFNIHVQIHICTHGILKQIYTGVTRREVIYLPPLQIDLFVFDKSIVCRDVN